VQILDLEKENSRMRRGVARTVGGRRDGRMTGCGDAREDRRREDQVTAAQWDG